MSFFKCIWIVLKRDACNDWGLFACLIVGVVGGS